MKPPMKSCMNILCTPFSSLRAPSLYAQGIDDATCRLKVVLRANAAEYPFLASPSVGAPLPNAWGEPL
jgi:hypothetical protein